MVNSLKIENPIMGRRFVIADIHGCCETFKALVKKIQLTRQDQLFLLGDYIDRGPDSAGVLDFMLALKDKGYQVYPLRGNHEATLLEDWHYYSKLKLFKDLGNFIKSAKANKTIELLDGKGNLKDRFVNFLQGLPFYYELDDFYLVHAGFDFTQEKPFEDYETMMWLRGFPNENIPLKQSNYKRIIVGHSVVPLDFTLKSIALKKTVVPLDNGCFYGHIYRNTAAHSELANSKVGHLCALDLDLMQVIVQECLD